MKKLFFIAAIAGAALASCTKNEVAQSVNDQKAISFATPVVGLTTKAPTYGLIEDKYPEEQGFSVWGWYSEKESYDGVGVAYMTDVDVEYVDTDHNAETPDFGAWEPATPYFWPKNGKLTFDAYSPSDIQGLEGCVVSCDDATGLTITNYTVPTDLTKQFDVLYSSRAYNKNSSIGSTEEPFHNYEGVDIMFNHALAAIKFNVAQAEKYAQGTIRLETITVNAHSTGTFTQNINEGQTGDAPEWTASTAEDYEILARSEYVNSIDLAETTTAEGVTTTTNVAYESDAALILPQVFEDTEATITLTYFIKNGDEEPLRQTHTFNLNDTVNQNGSEKDTEGKENGVTVASWDMGKIYTYNITISLQGIYFAPTVTGWTDVTVDLPQINN